MNVTSIIQTRIESTRLPAKALKPLAGLPLTAHVIRAMKAVPSINRVVVATGHDPVNRPLLDLAASEGADGFTGSPENVLDRYFRAAEKFGGEYIVRATGDNPFTDPDYAEMAVRAAIETRAHICSLSGLPLGSAVEVISAAALRDAHAKSTLPHQLEHVTPFIKENPGIYNIVRRESGFPKGWEKLRLTVDTPEDYELAKILFENLYRGVPIRLSEVISFIEKNPSLMAINASIEQRPMTHSVIKEQ